MLTEFEYDRSRNTKSFSKIGLSCNILFLFLFRALDFSEQLSDVGKDVKELKERQENSFNVQNSTCLCFNLKFFPSSSQVFVVVDKKKVDGLLFFCQKIFRNFTSLKIF